MSTNDFINDFFQALGAAFTEAFHVIADIFLDYFMLLLAIYFWIRFCSKLFTQGNLSYPLLVFALISTAGAYAMGQLFWGASFF